MRPGTAHRQQQKNVLQAITLPFLPYSDTDPTALRLIKYSGFVCRMPSTDARAHSVIQKDRMCAQELCIVQRCWRECVDSFICVQSWIVRKWNVFYDFRSARFCSHGNVASARVTEFRRLRLLFIIITCYCVYALHCYEVEFMASPGDHTSLGEESHGGTSEGEQRTRNLFSLLHRLAHALVHLYIV